MRSTRQPGARRAAHVHSPWLAAVTLTLIITVAGCSTSRGPRAALGSRRPSSFATHYGQNATDIAAHIPSCTAVTAGRVTAGNTTSVTLVSSCTLSQHQIVVYSWPDAVSEHQAQLLLATSPPSYSASGHGWTQIVADSAPLPVQLSIANAVAAALGGTVTRYP
jgi:hypothetical protein